MVLIIVSSLLLNCRSRFNIGSNLVVRSPLYCVALDPRMIEVPSEYASSRPRRIAVVDQTASFSPFLSSYLESNEYKLRSDAYFRPPSLSFLLLPFFSLPPPAHLNLPLNLFLTTS